MKFYIHFNFEINYTRRDFYFIGDNIRLKELTLCNFDFLLASVRTISVSYLRSILEHARFYLLDRDVELIYYTVRKSSDALTRDTLQLGAQIICWLRSCSGTPNECFIFKIGR